jgi:hypothetical protein
MQTQPATATRAVALDTGQRSSVLIGVDGPGLLAGAPGDINREPIDGSAACHTRSRQRHWRGRSSASPLAVIDCQGLFGKDVAEQGSSGPRTTTHGGYASHELGT